jgi:hypothetical protein
MAQVQYSIREHRGSTFTVEVREGEDVVAVRGFRSKFEADAWIADHKEFGAGIRSISVRPESSSLAIPIPSTSPLTGLPAAER